MKVGVRKSPDSNYMRSRRCINEALGSLFYVKKFRWLDPEKCVVMMMMVMMPSTIGHHFSLHGQNNSAAAAAMPGFHISFFPKKAMVMVFFLLAKKNNADHWTSYFSMPAAMTDSWQVECLYDWHMEPRATKLLPCRWSFLILSHLKSETNSPLGSSAFLCRYFPPMQYNHSGPIFSKMFHLHNDWKAPDLYLSILCPKYCCSSSFVEISSRQLSQPPLCTARLADSRLAP